MRLPLLPIGILALLPWVATGQSIDIYRFPGTAGDFVDITSGPFVGVGTLNYRLYDPGGTLLANRQFNLGQIGEIQLPASGDYTLEVGEASNRSTGTYEISIAAVRP